MTKLQYAPLFHRALAMNLPRFSWFNVWQHPKYTPSIIYGWSHMRRSCCDQLVRTTMAIVRLRIAPTIRRFISCWYVLVLDAAFWVMAFAIQACASSLPLPSSIFVVKISSRESVSRRLRSLRYQKRWDSVNAAKYMWVSEIDALWVTLEDVKVSQSRLGYYPIPRDEWGELRLTQKNNHFIQRRNR